MNHVNAPNTGAEIVLLISIVSIYLLPSIIAGFRGHPNATPIFILNLFLGWTFLGWLASLIWSTTSIQKVKE